MASDRETVAFLCEQMQGAGTVAARAMFGEYAISCDGKPVGVVCGNRLFLKALPEAQALLTDPAMEPPYPGARPHIVADDLVDEPERLSRLVAAIAAALPDPKPRRRKA